jgi:hypothetical protein
MLVSKIAVSNVSCPHNNFLTYDYTIFMTNNQQIFHLYSEQIPPPAGSSAISELKMDICSGVEELLYRTFVRIIAYPFRFDKIYAKIFLRCCW